MPTTPPYKYGDKLYIHTDENPKTVGRAMLYSIINGKGRRSHTLKNEYYHLGVRGDWILVLPVESLKPEQSLPDKQLSLKKIREEFPEALQVLPLYVKAEKYRGGYKAFL